MMTSVIAMRCSLSRELSPEELEQVRQYRDRSRQLAEATGANYTELEDHPSLYISRMIVSELPVKEKLLEEAVAELEALPERIQEMTQAIATMRYLAGISDAAPCDAKRPRTIDTVNSPLNRTSLKDPLDRKIEALLHSPGVMEALAGLACTTVPVNLDDFSSAASWRHLFGTTAGPFTGGVAGQGFTWYRLNVIHSDTAMVLFANGRFYGVAPYDGEALVNHDIDGFTRWQS